MLEKYSHLDLAGKIRVCPLPGRGFRGDWYIGVVDGSVSVNLGKNVIDMVTNKEEEYNRFVHGVGLPTRHIFDWYSDKDNKGQIKPTSFYAWPQADHVYLRQIIEIHRQAHSRHHIPDYPKFKSAISKIAQQLAKPGKSRESIKQLIERIPEQITILSD